jgi:C-terminal processing protease CtpA/Prc
VSWGVIDGTRIGYIYATGWDTRSSEEFAAAIDQLTQVQRVEALVIDFRLNTGGLVFGPTVGLAKLFEHPTGTMGWETRKRPRDHFKMTTFLPPGALKADFNLFTGLRDEGFYAGPIAVLVGPGTVSAGDFGALWARFLPRSRLFGKTTAMGAGLPTQAALGTELILHPEWSAAVVETNTSSSARQTTFSSTPISPWTSAYGYALTMSPREETRWSRPRCAG